MIGRPAFELYRQGRMHSRARHGFGVAPTFLPAPFVAKVTTGDGRTSYFRVLPEHQVAVGTSLSNFDVRASAIDGSDKAFVIDRYDGFRKPPRVNLGHAVAEAVNGRGIAIVGDPMKDTLIRVYVGRSLEQIQAAEPEGHWYVLYDPDGGWQPGWQPAPLFRKAALGGAGLMWGAIIGGGLALAVIVMLARRKR